MGKKILVIGGGGREHALAWKIAQSPHVERVYVAPGNAGTALEEKMENVDIDASDIHGLLAWAKENIPDLTVVGPEQPLTLGIVDVFQKNALRIFGPTKAAAQLEWSKSFAKEFLVRHAIPTAAYKVFQNLNEAEIYIREQGAPIVIKADGLATGKGVLVATTVDDAIAFANECLSGSRFGESGSRIVVEEFMEGEEATCIAIVDGTNFSVFPMTQDHKRIFDGDKGPNTGGVGAYSPVPKVTIDVEKKIIETIIQPTIVGMKESGVPFTGFLYTGLMINKGNPKVVEFNARFGDPETQPIMMRLASDFVELIESAIAGTLDRVKIDIDQRPALCIVMASGGYPEHYTVGEEITGIENAEKSEGVKVFHAGTKESDGKIVTNGGRVLGVTALGETIALAQKRAYEAVGKIHFNKAHYRTDIGWRAIEL